MVRIGQALTSLARDPFPFLLVVLSCRLIHQHNLGWFAWVIASGYCVSVFLQALRADAAPPPRSRDLPRTAYLGCVGGCGLYFAGLLVLVGVACVLGGLGLQRFNPTERAWTHPVGQTAVLLLMVWLTQAAFASMLLACSKVRGFSGTKSPFNGYFLYLGSFLSRPPLNGGGLRLGLLLALVLVTTPLLEHESNTLVQYASLMFATLYAHCLGQYVRKGHGFQIS